MSGDPSEHQNSATAGDWQFGNLAMGMVSANPSICQGIQMGSSSCPPVSMVETFTPNLWNHPANLQNPAFSENAAAVSNVPIGKPVALSPRLDMGWNAADPTISRMGIFPTPNPGMLPPSLSDFTVDSSFIERAARFSSFSGGILGAMPNPFGTGKTSSPYASTSKNGVQNQGFEMVRDVSLSIDHGPKSESPMKSQRDNLVGGEESPDLPNISGDSSSKGLSAKKRKKNNQDMELDQGGSQFSGESSRENVGAKHKLEHNSSTQATGKSTRNDVKGSTDAGKEDYIHVRARRGQATNSHSLAERVRRERISERMKYLQDLVPGCSKVTGKAVMLDEIINYVQSLQRQVEFLSMKLATVNPSLDFNIEGLLSKDLLQSRGGPSTMGFSQELIHQQLLPSQLGLVQTGIPGIVNQSDALRRAINAQFATVNGFKEPATQLQNPWEADLQNVFQMAYGTNPPSSTQELNSKPHEGFPS